MGAALAVVVDTLAVGEERPAEVVDGRKLAEGQHVDQGGGEILRVQRTARQIDDRRAGNHVPDPHRPGGIGGGSRDVAESGAAADGDGRLGVAHHLLQGVDRALAADGTVDAAVFAGDGALDDADVLALVLLHRRLLGGFGLVAGRSHQRLVVFQGDQIEDDRGGGRLVGAQEGFRIAGAVLKFEPDHGDALVLDGRGHLGHQAQRQGQGRSGCGTELDEVAAADAPGLHPLQNLFRYENRLRMLLAVHRSDLLCS